jgi:hypothetical protein
MLNGDMSCAFISRDGGMTWETIHHAQLRANIRCQPGFRPKDVNVILAARGYSGALHVSDDQGRTWQKIRNVEGRLEGEIEPPDGDGSPSPEGKVGFISFGMSNTTPECQVFLQEIAALKLAPPLAVVDGAQGGKKATASANESEDQRTGRTAWEELAARLEASGVSPPQVQVVWMKLAVARPAAGGDCPAHVGKFEQLVVTSRQKLKARYPNVRLVYLSNRIYAGYATTPLNPELNYDPEKGEVKAPLLPWGPDLWANGTTARAEGLLWEESDIGPDGTHPSLSGRQEVAGLLLGSLRTDPTASIWFLEEEPTTESRQSPVQLEPGSGADGRGSDTLGPDLSRMRSARRPMEAMPPLAEGGFTAIRVKGPGNPLAVEAGPSDIAQTRQR